MNPKPVRRGRKAAKRIQATAAPERLTAPFPIVGVGSSAGGLQAFTELLEHLPADTGMAFILVQHLDPDHESALPHILSRSTPMPVREAQQGMLVAPNEVYVIPANATLRLAGGRLDLVPRENARTPHFAINSFFKSLAEEQREAAVGVVFSGTGIDGTLGLEAIKAAGGITFAQDSSARYDSMPRSAVGSGCVDQVMAPAKVAQELARMAKHPYLRGPSGAEPPGVFDGAFPAAAPATRDAAIGRPRNGASSLDGFTRILEVVREQSGVDFSLYKTSTIHRRITRRMLLGRKDSLEEYARWVKADAKELKALYGDLLISVTSFFRDEPAFDALKQQVFPRLLADRRSDPIRIWSVGCSSGQEPYSLGMAFLEATADCGERTPKLQIFGTDLNEALLSKARQGLYPHSLADEISPARLRRFFVEENGGYRVIKALREVCIFARQDLLGDPPFSRMDLVTCRNVMIYLEAAAQKRILPMLHYALNPGGFLFLGTSESVGAYTDLFEPADKKQKIFARRAATTPVFTIPYRDRVRATKAPGARDSQRLANVPLRTELHAQHEGDRVMVNLFAPPGVLVDAAFNVLQFHGTTDAFLAAPAGKASFALLKLAREGLMLPLRAALTRARTTNEPVRREKIRLKGGPVECVDLRVIPLRNLRERHFLVLFEVPGTQAAAPPAVPERAEPRGERQLRRRVVALERELRETRDYLQSLQQQHDTANDELQASNEEVQSTNEELQSINEELETSKEELESGNEELVTVNEEMAYRNGELSRLNSDLNNFHVSISTPIVVLGRDLTIRRFTPLAEKLFNLLPTDIGRPIGDIRHNLEVADIEGFVGKVIDLLAVREAEVRDQDGRWYLLRARPYLTADNKVDGAVLVLLDIDALKRSEQAITQERNYAEATLRTARDPLVILRPDLTVNTANDAFYRTFELTPANTENCPFYELADGAWNIPALRTLLAEVLPRNHFFNDLEVTHPIGARGVRTMLLNGRRLESEEGAPLRILLSIEDVTERRRSTAALRASETYFRELTESLPIGVWTSLPGGTVDFINRHWLDYTGQVLELSARSPEAWLEIVHPDDRARVKEASAACRASGDSYAVEARIRQASTGQYRWFLKRSVPVRDANGEIQKRIGMSIDIDDQKRAQHVLRDHAGELEGEVKARTGELRETIGELEAFSYSISHDMRAPLRAMQGYSQLLVEKHEATLDARSLDHLRRISASAARLDALIGDVLTYSRLLRSEIVLQPVELDDLVRNVIASYPQLQANGAEVTIAGRLPRVLANEATLTQAISNLLTNAVKFVAAGTEARVHVRAETIGDDVRLWIEDNGIGIAPCDHERIWTIFTRVVRAKDYEGTGIGLAIVRKAVERMSGTIGLESQLGQGSRFWLRLRHG